jgi:hypothetical protein
LVKIGNVNNELTDTAAMRRQPFLSRYERASGRNAYLPHFGFAEHPGQILRIAVFYRAGRYSRNVVRVLRFHSRDYLGNT